MAMAPPPPLVQVRDDLIKGREFAAQLQGLLRDSPKAGLIMDQILHSFSRAIHAANSAAAASASERSSDVQSEVTDGASGGGKRKSAAAGGNRRACRRRTHESSVTKNMKSLDDGQAWRKYGQKDIHNSKHSRSYFRCTHKYDQQCTAQRQVQLCDDDSGMFRVTYIGVHTCQDPATAVAPHVLHLNGTGDGMQMHAGCRLISFAPGVSTAAAHGTTTSTTTTTTTLNSNLVDQDAPAGSDGLQGLKLESGGDQEEVLSSRTPGSSALHSTAAAATAPTWQLDQGDVTSSLQYAGNFGDYFEDDYRYLGNLLSCGLDH